MSSHLGDKHVYNLCPLWEAYLINNLLRFSCHRSSILFFPSPRSSDRISCSHRSVSLAISCPKVYNQNYDSEFFPLGGFFLHCCPPLLSVSGALTPVEPLANGAEFFLPFPLTLRNCPWGHNRLLRERNQCDQTEDGWAMCSPTTCVFWARVSLRACVPFLYDNRSL